MSNVFKRSKTARLIMMVPAAGLMLTGCGEEPVEVQVYNTPDECAAFYNPPAQCQAAFAEAKALHPQVAPRYHNKTECETDFGSGQCESAPIIASNSIQTGSETAPQAQSQQSSGFFMPMMMGFMAGQMLNRGGLGGQAPQAATKNASPVASQPLYKSRDDRQTFRTATNTAVAKQPGATRIKPSSVQPKPAAMARRGGFGAQAARRSSTRSSFGG
ncbi:DUF1190 domain-containing protein [Rheinheimera salexigens]|uniref:DUF1190 domain-containing protein n=1 Tax=Rheinheimera salexigens TaxID=1628148 RepID=A0A1E7Q2V6_9GAMM|nr:DUF1190 domain-containing protein [Rheinheimera salexigens]OEY68466.1 hypothetical protein BI198_01935 [Rheinheimera salexigens]